MHPTDLDIADYVDDSLSPADRAAVEQHLEGCRECRALVADFLELRRTVAALVPMEPPPRAWSRIEAEIVGSRKPLPTRFSVVWLAAAAALVLATAGGLWTIRAQRRSVGTAPTVEASPAQSIEAELVQAEQHYQKAFSGLEQIANAEKGALDPATAATLQKNLGVVDQAINESRAALQAEPSSDPARESLLASFKAKVDLLQNTIALINDMRKGNDAGAAQIISGLKRGS
jgi:anti-sigma factor RsiW